MILRDTTFIEARPETIFQFFEEIEDHYLAWHPDHVLFRWVRGRGLAEGNIFHFEERIAGKLLRKRVVFTRIVTGEHIEFAPTFWLMRMFLPRMVFRMQRRDGGLEFVAEVHLRMGPLAQWAHRRELQAVREHMRVEGVNLKRFAEDRERAAAA